MLTIARQRLQEDDEDGFTLIELMVVVLIIAILLAIAIPTFLGAQNRARDRSAQSNLRNGLTAAKTIATDDAGTFTGVTATTLNEAEGALAFFDLTGDTERVGVVDGGTADHVLLYTQSASDTWYGIATTQDGDVTYCTGTTPAAVSVFDDCQETEW